MSYRDKSFRRKLASIERFTEQPESITEEWLLSLFDKEPIYFPTIWFGADVHWWKGGVYAEGQKLATITTSGQFLQLLDLCREL